MAKKKSPEDQLSSLVHELHQKYVSWQHYHEKGGRDPFWPDGLNMKNLRNHVINLRSEIKALCESHGLALPEELSRPVPQEVPDDYMARSKEIRDHAKETLRQYKEDPNYQYVIQNQSQITPVRREKICLPAILGYVSVLETAIAEDDLIVMRRHGFPSLYLDSFGKAANDLRKEILNAEHENFQLSLF